MMKTLLAAGVSLLALSAVTTAQAKTVGHIAGGVNYVGNDDDFFGGKDVNQYQFNFQGAAGFDLTPTWNVQFDAAFNSDRYSGDIFSGKTVAVDTWRAGTQAYWRDEATGMFGLEVAYQSLDYSIIAIDGFLVGLRGEYYVNDNFTLGGGVNYNTYEASSFTSLDTFTANLFGTYYVNDKTGISLRGNYSSTDVTGAPDNLDGYGVSADVEYLFQNNLSLSGLVSYGNTDFITTDFDRFTVGAKLKIYFGTEGSLAHQQRTSTLEPTTSGFNLPIFGGISP